MRMRWWEHTGLNMEGAKETTAAAAEADRYGMER